VAEIARLDSVWLNAYVTADVDAVRPILAEDFVGQIYDTVMDREDLLDRVANATGVEETNLESLVVNIFAEAAVVHAVRRDVVRRDGETVESRYAYTDVYVYRNGRWQCITGQSAPIVGDG
jgi:ketosteroid isomerase-like protein